MSSVKKELVHQLRHYKNFFLSLFSGLESGLATTAAVVVGLSLTTESQTVVAATALISAIVQAWNSAMSTISSGHTGDVIDHPYAKDHYRLYVEQGGLQFMSHVIASVLPILPLVLMSDETMAVTLSIVITLVMLTSLGYNKARVVQRPKMRGAFEELVPGVLVISIGYLAGFMLS